MLVHRKIKSVRSGDDGWRVVCSCGRTWRGWRWWAEEQYDEHRPADDDPQEHAGANQDPDMTLEEMRARNLEAIYQVHGG